MRGSEADRGFEYRDHTADVQIHSWGTSLKEAFANAALGMTNVLTPIDAVCATESFAFEAEGHDVESLLFAFLDECLFQFHSELRVCQSMKITHFSRSPWKISAEGTGEIFDPSRHESGTEVKAVTYSAMKVVEGLEGQAEVFVIVDI